MTPGSGTRHDSTTPPRAYTREELINVAALVGLLEKKETILTELTAMNNQAEKMVQINHSGSHKLTFFFFWA